MGLEKPRRIKKTIPEMFPTKKWLTWEESCAYLAMSKNHFLKLAIENHLTISAIGNFKYFKVDQLDSLIERNIIVH